MSLYSDYLKETGSKDILERDCGFATYTIRGQECYIEDIYVIPEKRNSDVASQMADEVSAIAKAKGCVWLTGSVNTAIKDPTRSIKVLLSYGFKFLRSEPHIIWFVKEL